MVGQVIKTPSICSPFETKHRTTEELVIIMSEEEEEVLKKVFSHPEKLLYD